VVKVSVEIRSGVACLSVAVRANNIQEALRLVSGRYPKGGVVVTFPIDPDSFFVEDPSARAGIVGFEQSEETAA
jgi:hypothetical protein